ncbi:MAG: AgmX/PglI C-terminal domain-containing protein [Bdellovibrionales bacterium]|nr:AgmX/PglI C-terminal domain-containing protein [Bdellovibrionales bacterium]
MTKHKSFLRLQVRLEKMGQYPQEWHFDDPKSVSFGYLVGNDLWLPIPGLDPQSELIVRRRDHIFIRIADHFDGAISQSGEEIPLESWKTTKNPSRHKGAYLFDLIPKTQLVLYFAEFKLILWISRPPLSEKKRTLVESFKRIVEILPKFFIVMVLLSSIIHLVILGVLYKSPPIHSVIAPQITKDFRRLNISVALQEKLDQAAAMGIKLSNRRSKKQKRPLDPSGFIKAVQAPKGTMKNSSFSSLFTTQSFSNDLNKALESKSFSDVLKAQMKKMKSTPKGRSLGGSNSSDSEILKVELDATIDQPGTDLNLQKGKVTIPKSTLPIQGSTGTLDSRAINEVATNRQGELNACYEEALNMNPSLKSGGKLVLQFDIGENGATQHIQITESNIRDPSLNACLVKSISSWTFPKPKGGTVPVRLPLIFSSSS